MISHLLPLLPLLAAFGLHASWWLWRWGPEEAQGLLAGLLYVPVFAASALACAWRARQTPGREGHGWASLALAVAAFGVGQLVYALLQEVFRRPPFPSLADAFFLAFPLLAGAALTLFARGGRARGSGRRLGLNLAVLLACSATFSWHFLVAGLLDSYTGRPLEGAIALAYPLSDLGLLLLTLLFLSRDHALRGMSGVWLVAGLFAFIVADSGYAWLSASGSYVPGQVIDLFWSLGGLAFGLSATRPALTTGALIPVALTPVALNTPAAPPGESADDPPWVTGALVVSVCATITLLSASLGGAGATPEQRGLAVLAGAALLLGAARGLHALRENARLTGMLRGRTAQLERQVQHDLLTGLPNRWLLHQRLTAAIAEAPPSGEGLGLLYLDLDGFKLVNDTLGHGAGDALLVAVAGYLRGTLGPGDTVARFGGDEFVLLLRGVGDDDDLAARARQVAAAVATETELLGERVTVRASVGVARYPQDALDADGLLQQADAALYRAKHGGRSDICFVTPAITAAAGLRGRLSDELRWALRRGEFHLVYQPQVCAAHGTLLSFEALLRWTSPTLGPVSPADFIPVAEETGVIADIGAWVLDTVCCQLRQWRDDGLEVVPVAVNVSPGQFARADFVPALQTCLERHGLEGALLELELTEGAVVRELEVIARTMRAVLELGVRLAVDDFGAGRTSLSYLLQLPVHTVKLDRSLLTLHVTGEQQGRAGILPAVVTLAHALGLGVVAEGVETSEHLQMLARSGCERIQGYLTGRPEPAPAAAGRLPRLTLPHGEAPGRAIQTAQRPPEG